MIVRDPDIEDLAVGVNAVNDALAVGGYRPRAAAVGSRSRTPTASRFLLIYNYKRGSWYPFVPAPRQAAQHRARAADQGGHPSCQRAS
jgi:hypothetical protein